MRTRHVDDALLASIVRSSLDAIVAFEPDGTIASWNRGAEEMYGHREEDVVGHPIDVYVPEMWRQADRDSIAAVAAGGSVAPHVGERLCSDGSTMRVSSHLSPVTDEAGTVVAVVSIERGLADPSGIDSPFRDLIEAAPDAIVAVHGNGTIIVVNAQACTLFGYEAHEMIGRPVDMLVPEDFREAHPRHRADYLASPRTRFMGAGDQLSARRKDGSVFPADISLNALEMRNGLTIVAAVRDATERLAVEAERARLKDEAMRDRLENQQHQSQRLESLGQLAGGVAHDFNNLLAVILNYASFVGEEISRKVRLDHDDTWYQILADIEQIQRAAERAAVLTHQLLSFARREVVRPQIIDVNDVITQIEKMLVRTIGEHVTLATDLDRDIANILIDPGQLEQVLVNLVVNARDALEEGGTVTLRTLPVDARAPEIRESFPAIPPGPYVGLAVEDDGAGMSKDVADRAFEPFFSTKPRGEGSGLGLATVYGIVTQAGGRVRIDSEVGKGTRVFALFPATDYFDAPADFIGSGIRSPRGETILVVEDEVAMREVTRRILSRNGYVVITAPNGPEAIDAATNHPGDIDLLLTDVVMPFMLGKEVADRILGLRPEMMVLYMSGYAQPVITAQGHLESDTHLIEKPFSESDLLYRVREVLDRR